MLFSTHATPVTLATAPATAPTTAATLAPITAWIALGANLGNPMATLEAAIAALAELPCSRLSARSAFYRTAPLGLTDQPDFINAVVALDILEPDQLPPHALLQALFAIEAHFGRLRSVINAPRTLDLDLLLYGDIQLNTTELTLPHPRMHERAFVLVPLVEIAPDCCIPGQGPAALRMDHCQDQRIERLG